MRSDGGAAFPEVFSTFNAEKNTLTDVYSAGGMTLRDYFAAAALPALVTMSSSISGDTWKKVIAEGSYSIADAMLAERDKP